MKTTLDCLPCFIRQGLEAARFVTDDPAIHEQILRELLHEVAQMELSQCPPVVAQNLHRKLRLLTGVSDPYQEIKNHFNTLILKMVPDLRTKISEAKDPLFMALRLAITGNIIDLGVSVNIEEEEILKAIDNTLIEPFLGDIATFRNAVDQAQSILYLADNAGEIVFDRLLIERLPLSRLTVAVRGNPVLNDATLIDAKQVGLCEIVEVIDNGSDAPGTILTDCSKEFRHRFNQADLVIAKGQGNFETLTNENKNLYFLLKAKCSVIASHIGIPLGTHVAIPSNKDIRH